jgi:hypothetical protein
MLRNNSWDLEYYIRRQTYQEHDFMPDEKCKIANQSRKHA